MRVMLKGIATATKTLASGERRTYYYAWRGGPKLEGQPGSAAFVASYNAAIASRKSPREDRLGSLVEAFRSSSEYTSLGERSRRSYNVYLKMIETKFGSMPIAALAEPRVKDVFMTWRDKMAATPRKADYAWSTLARVLSVAKKRGKITINPCEGAGRLYESDRADKVWSEVQIAALLSVAPRHMVLPILLALWTGQRQGDLLSLPWSAYDGKYIRLRQGKTGVRVTVPVGETLRKALDAEPRRGPQILMTSRKVPTPWTESGFRASWRKLLAKAGLSEADRNFHDFRGTAITRLSIAGATVQEIQPITGHSLKTIQGMLDAHYLGQDMRLAENAIIKLERFYK